MASSCIPASSGNRIIEVADPIGVAPGLRVRIELASGKLLLASFLAYVFPLIFLFAGALIGFSTMRESSGELGGGVGALIGLAAGLVLARIYARRLAARGKINPVVTGIVPDGDREGE